MITFGVNRVNLHVLEQMDEETLHTTLRELVDQYVTYLRVSDPDYVPVQRPEELRMCETCYEEYPADFFYTNPKCGHTFCITVRAAPG